MYTKLPRELGIIMRCNGVEGRPNCKAKLQTGQIEARGIRAYAATLQWGRGIRKGRKRCDLCPDCMPIERKLFEEAKAKSAQQKAERDERRKAMWAEKRAAKEAEAAANPKPTKPRKKKASSEPGITPSSEADLISDESLRSSPSEACAPAPSM